MAKIKSTSVLFIIIGAVLLGRLAYMNLRSDDPLPHGFQDYNAESFQAAQANGDLIMVDVYASWCPTCMAQHDVLETLLKDERYTDIKGFRVDFEDDLDFVRKYSVQAQSTIIMFTGRKEISRTIGQTSQAGIRAQVDDAVIVANPPIS